MPTSSGPFEVRLTPPFDRSLRRFLRRHPGLESTFRRLVKDLEDDPFQPKLRLHALGGKLDGFYAVSLTYSYRVVLLLKVEEHRIRLVDIGDHDDVYR